MALIDFKKELNLHHHAKGYHSTVIKFRIEEGLYLRPRRQDFGIGFHLIASVTSEHERHDGDISDVRYTKEVLLLIADIEDTVFDTMHRYKAPLIRLPDVKQVCITKRAVIYDSERVYSSTLSGAATVKKYL